MLALNGLPSRTTRSSTCRASRERSRRPVLPVHRGDATRSSIASETRAFLRGLARECRVEVATTVEPDQATQARPSSARLAAGGSGAAARCAAASGCCARWPAAARTCTTSRGIEPLQQSDFFADGSARRGRWSTGTVARGQLRDERRCSTPGMIDGRTRPSSAFPIPVTRAMLERGQRALRHLLRALPRRAPATATA